MVWNLRVIFAISFIFTVVNAITNGHTVQGQKRYVVYLLQDPNAKQRQKAAWLCGGAIISHLYILTSAACIYDSEKVYVISGYNKYVNAKDMEKDKCIMATRRRIVQTCTAKCFSQKYMFNRRDYWQWGDISVAKIDVPFNFNDQTYNQICSYIPAPIRVNLMQKFVEDGREVISLGWGHREFYRPTGETIDLNEEYLRYGAGKITQTGDCVAKWKFDNAWKIFRVHVRRFFICVDRPGSLDEDGHILPGEDVYSMCNNKVPLRRNGSDNYDNSTDMDCLAYSLRQDKNVDNAATGGICQNDHGGPLVTWIGGHETLIGVASFFPLTKEMRCRTPYLYTSTVCFNRVIACAVESKVGSRRAMNCDKIMQDKENVEIKDILW